VLAAGVALQLIQHGTTAPGYYVRSITRAETVFFFLFLLVAALGAATVLTGFGRRLYWTAVTGLLVASTALGVWIIRVSLSSPIDVFTAQRAAIRALARGESPYSMFRNLPGEPV